MNPVRTYYSEPIGRELLSDYRLKNKMTGFRKEF